LVDHAAYRGDGEQALGAYGLQEAGVGLVRLRCARPDRLQVVAQPE
jgi:hypothetical protein